MIDKKLLFIYNPHAGKAQIKNHLFNIIDIFVKAGYETTVYPTQHSGDGMKKTMQSEGLYDLLVCSGGDGTLDEVVTGMMLCETKIPIGYIPAGSTNDFANSLGLPKNMGKAAYTAVYGQSFPCDIGSFNQDSFVYIAAFGLFTDVSYETKQQVKNVLGHMAYLLEGMKKLTSIKSYPLKIIADGRLLEGDFIFGMVTNSVMVGGFKSITGKNVCFDDGVFELVLIKRPKNALELQGIMASIVTEATDERYMYSLKAQNIQIESNVPIAWTLDGEFGGRHKNVVIKNEKQAVEILIPFKK